MDADSAPGRLSVVEEFINTVDLRPYREELGTPAALEAWLRQRGLLAGDGGEAGEDDLRRALGLREALRRLALANGGGTVYPVDLAALNAAAQESGLRVRFHAGGVRIEPEAGGVVGALGRLVAIVQGAMADGSWERLKACAADDCRWVFYDHSKNAARSWCSMRSCGNRAKAQAYRKRKSGSG